MSRPPWPASIPQPSLFYRFAHGLGRWFWPLMGGIEVRGRENLPADGPYLLVSNHQSVLDPLLILTWIDRPVHAMAKSTQFTAPIVGPALRQLYAYPVRRFQTDPQAVRITLRRLEQGQPVQIYVEGERTWDGRLQPPRPGSIRIALKAGVPIVPCAIAGAYDVWPRWARMPHRGRVVVSFGEPFRLPRIHDRRERNAAVPAASARIIGEIARLLGVDPPTGVSDEA